MKPNSYSYTQKRGFKGVFPGHPAVVNWAFEVDQEEEAELASAMAAVAEKNGMSVNDLHHLFPAVLRMLKSDIQWSK